MGKNLINKAIYVSYMCNNLLSCILKRSDFDDRDSYVNKRIDFTYKLKENHVWNLQKRQNEYLHNSSTEWQKNWSILKRVP